MLKNFLFFIIFLLFMSLVPVRNRSSLPNFCLFNYQNYQLI